MATMPALTLEFGAVTVRGRAGSEVHDQLRTVLAAFEPYVDRFQQGFSLQMGWGPFALRPDGEHTYDVVVPDYAGDPNDLTTDLTQAIWLLAGQVTVLRAAKVEDPAPTTYTEDVTCVRGALSGDQVLMTRSGTATGNDSGWFIEPFPQTRTEPWDAGDLIRMPAWRLLQDRRHAARVLDLPAGIAAVVGDNAVRAVIRESDRSVLSNGPL